MEDIKAEQQLVFLQKMQRLLDEGSFTSTYKYALILSLVDIAVESPRKATSTLDVSVRYIAEKFIQIYWRQAVDFPSVSGDIGELYQNSASQAAVINKINQAYLSCNGQLTFLKKDVKRYQNLMSDVAKIVRDMPLRRLQTAGSQVDEFLYSNDSEPSQITLLPGVAYCLRQFHAQLTAMTKNAWVSWIRRAKNNQKILGQSTDLADFLFGSERNSLGKYVPLLENIQKGKCFYCNSQLHGSSEVDHFIPWSRYPVDYGHNFVLAHKGCNGSKGNMLAAEYHLKAWCSRNQIFEHILNSYFDEHGLTHNLHASNSIANWAYQQAKIAGSQLWLSKGETCHFSSLQE